MKDGLYDRNNHVRLVAVQKCRSPPPMHKSILLKRSNSPAKCRDDRGEVTLTHRALHLGPASSRHFEYIPVGQPNPLLG